MGREYVSKFKAGDRVWVIATQARYKMECSCCGQETDPIVIEAPYLAIIDCVCVFDGYSRDLDGKKGVRIRNDVRYEVYMPYRKGSWEQKTSYIYEDSRSLFRTKQDALDYLEGKKKAESEVEHG